MHQLDYHVGNLLQTAADSEETVSLTLPDNQTVTARLYNREDGITVSINGVVTVDDVCARCGEPLQLEVFLPGDEVEAEIINGSVNLVGMANDEVELARPTLSYCNKCQKIN